MDIVEVEVEVVGEGDTVLSVRLSLLVTPTLLLLFWVVCVVGVRDVSVCCRVRDSGRVSDQGVSVGAVRCMDMPTWLPLLKLCTGGGEEERRMSG